MSATDNAIRWAHYSRRSMQRLGFIKWVLSCASTSRAQSLESLSRAFASRVSLRGPIPGEFAERFDRFVTLLKLQRRYELGAETAELQDLLLSDDSLPSQSGSITGDIDAEGYRHTVHVEVPTWATRLDLLRENSHTLTERGRVLLMLDPSFGSRAASLREGQLGRNPMSLDPAERFAFLFVLLDSDGDLIREMLGRLARNGEFNRALAGIAALEGLKALRAARLSSATSGKLLQLRVHCDRVIKSMEDQKPSGMGPRESVVTPRTEPLVDCLVLEKPSPGSYEYRFTAWGAKFVEALTSAPSVSTFVLNGLAACVAESVGKSISPQPPTLDAAVPAYSRLRSGMGYVSMRELSMAVVAEAFRNERPLHEIASVEGAIASGTKDRRVRLAAGRVPGRPQVRIDLSPTGAM